MDKAQWLKLMKSWGFEENLQTLSDLEKAYAQAGRYYHNAQHIQACLKHYDVIESKLSHPREVELALWFHDAIYKIFSSNNEKNSALWARDFLLTNDAAQDAAGRVYDLILATEHNAPAATLDASYLVDIDLSILGANPNVYAQFEQNIRREYRVVPSTIYRKKRIAVLQSFLVREKIFNNEPFYSLLEAQARVNVEGAVARLTT
ncbi:hypothetical protein [Marinagarivorans cellulosilyticus]|uniref:N-methyl-D-aspartate receptor NMDAR2C subunit n=1 Tax=Marinagarivorans cellulosilyticus TaxID=2721545 RepID=A0AAN1WFH0_9GAMM|nr:hypothetical protein [Marinagarivorans cellulosilyticus]BCD96642.1 hypothetical protein MARGE09_P0842 [Marinagarivorans cellulosilyticus]